MAVLATDGPVDVRSVAVVPNASGAGVASYTLGLAPDNYVVELQLVENGYYVAPVETVAVTVVEPGTGFTTGGGWLLEPNTGRRGHFGFTAKYLKNGNVQGNGLYIYRAQIDIGQGLKEYNWIIKSNAMLGLAQQCSTAAPECTSRFSGKSNITAVDRVTGVAYSLGGNYQFQVDVTDRGEPGSAASPPPDSYAIRVWNDAGTYYVLGTYAGPTNTGQIAIAGGNIQVRPQ